MFVEMTRIYQKTITKTRCGKRNLMNISQIGQGLLENCHVKLTSYLYWLISNHVILYLVLHKEQLLFPLLNTFLQYKVRNVKIEMINTVITEAALEFYAR